MEDYAAQTSDECPPPHIERLEEPNNRPMTFSSVDEGCFVPAGAVKKTLTIQTVNFCFSYSQLLEEI